MSGHHSPDERFALRALVFVLGCAGAGLLAGLAWRHIGLPGAITSALIMFCVTSVALGRDSVPGIDPDRL